jgi:hypothetical protein
MQCQDFEPGVGTARDLAGPSSDFNLNVEIGFGFHRFAERVHIRAHHLEESRRQSIE